jgi:hypothetical protein
MMFKVLVIQRYYNLSDEVTAASVHDSQAVAGLIEEGDGAAWGQFLLWRRDWDAVGGKGDSEFDT